ncbi:AAA domain-containing protein [Numidum massiliense]|uniref:AAA domain-containing protein n=1 Tax=Numidum massiliense TaxID=1522315 RepID=UPI0006D5749D|nr:AAA domain-containing protein [Numidum massiliense]
MFVGKKNIEVKDVQDLRSKTEQLFAYLSALHEMKSPPIRDYKSYEKHWATVDFPFGTGCYLFGEGDRGDAWLEVHKQKIDPPPQPSPLIRTWLKDDSFRDPSASPQFKKEKLVQSVTRAANGEKEVVTVYFGDDPKRVQVAKQWLQEWRAWAKETKHKQSVQRLYGQLFNMYQRFEREGELLELAFGHGLLTLSHAPEDVYRPVLVTPCDLRFDPEKGVFYVIPTQKGTLVETDMLTGIHELKLDHMEALKRQYEEDRGLDPLDQESASAFYKAFVQSMHADGQYKETIDAKLPVQTVPIIYNESVLFMRRRGLQLLREDLNRTVELIKSGDIDASKTIKVLLSEDERVTTLSPEDQHAWKSVAEDVYFPLPANEEQRDIVRRVSGSIGVTVQGPPGTGKSHTIANLIANFLAHGKRVLVTSQTEKALAVLADKIPENIRALCVSYLGGDGQSIKQIEGAINQISEKMGTLDTERLATYIARDRNELHDARRDIQEQKTLLKEWAEKENDSCRWYNQTLKPLEAAHILRNASVDHSWLRDEVELNAPFPLAAQEMKELWALRDALQPADVFLREATLPQADDLLTVEQFNEWVNDFETLSERVKQT